MLRRKRKWLVTRASRWLSRWLHTWHRRRLLWWSGRWTNTWPSRWTYWRLTTWNWRWLKCGKASGRLGWLICRSPFGLLARLIRGHLKLAKSGENNWKNWQNWLKKVNTYKCGLRWWRMTGLSRGLSRGLLGGLFRRQWWWMNKRLCSGLRYGISNWASRW